MSKQTVTLTLSRTRTLKIEIPEGADARTVLRRTLQLEEGEVVVSATVDGRSDPDPSNYTRPSGESR